MRSLLWRQSHPGAVVFIILVVTGIAALTGAFWIFAGLLLWLFQDTLDRWHAGRQGYHARFWTSAPAWWVRRCWRQLGGQPLPTGPIWEIHAQDQHRWAGSPPEAARAYRAAYAQEMAQLIVHRPTTVTLCCTTFNRLTPGEVQTIQNAGGQILPGPLHSRLPRIFTPRTVRSIQRRMFGGIVSTTVRSNPRQWTTWIVPAAQPVTQNPYFPRKCEL